MDIISLIEIIIAIGVICLFIRFIVSPVLRVVLSIVGFIVLIYLLQRFFGFNIDQVLSPFGISLNINKLGINLNWIMEPVNHYIDQIKSFISYIWSNVPKSLKP